MKLKYKNKLIIYVILFFCIFPMITKFMVIPLLDLESELWRNYSLSDDPVSAFRIIENTESIYFNPSQKEIRGMCYKHIDENRDAVREKIKLIKDSKKIKYRKLIYAAWGDSRTHYLDLSHDEFIMHNNSLIKYLFE